ncbi:MAG: hypothetical protein JF599_00120 [Verrucomicrobia bacterium]|nr:hypothetical protein [Verrucomicrobiota bacterium]
MDTFLAFLLLAVVLILPAWSAYRLSVTVHGALKKKESKWAMTAGILTFIGAYLAILCAIVTAMAYAGLFRR